MNRMVCKIINLSVPRLGVLCPLAGVNPRVRAFQINAKFARAAQTLKQYEVHEGFGFFLIFYFPLFLLKLSFFVIFVSFVVDASPQETQKSSIF